MIEDNLYMFEVHINRIIVSTKIEGDVSLFLRIGKTTSSILKAKSYDGTKIIFESVLRCNCDQSALDTKRFSITINMKTSSKESKVMGIVMIPLESQPKDEFQFYKISQCSDNQATILLKYSVSMIGEKTQLNKKGSGLSSSLTPKSSEENKKSTYKSNITSIRNLENKKEKSRYLEALFQSSTSTSLPTQKFIEDVKNLQKEQFYSQNEEIAKLQKLNSLLVNANSQLKRQKEFLKEILKIEITKSNFVTNFLQRTYKVFTQYKINENKSAEKPIKEKAFQKDKELDQMNKFYNSVSSIGRNSTITPFTQNEAKSLLQIGKMDKNSLSDSNISFCKMSGINEDFQNLFKDSIKKETETSKSIMEQLRKVVMDESDLKHERRLRSVKIKVQKTYLQLFKQSQPFTKEHIMKQKVNLNKILDELVMCKIST